MEKMVRIPSKLIAFTVKMRQAYRMKMGHQSKLWVQLVQVFSINSEAATEKTLPFWSLSVPIEHLLPQLLSSKENHFSHHGSRITL